MPRDVLLGVVTGATGLKGEVKVKTFTQHPGKLGAYGALHTRDGRKLVVRHMRAGKDSEAVVLFDGISDRESAERLKGAELCIARDSLPAAGPDEFYHADLVGLRAEDAQGRVLGIVSAIRNFGAGDVIEIARGEGDTLMLPFTRAIVPEVHVAEGYLLVVEPVEIEASKQGFVE